MVADEGLADDEPIIVHFGAPEANASVNERCGGLVGGSHERQKSRFLWRKGPK